MEKKRKNFSLKQGILQEWHIGRIVSCMLFFMACPAALMAQQEPAFTVDFRESGLTEVFDWFSSNSDYIFTFNSAEVKRADVRVSRSFKNASLARILGDCLAETPFAFEVVGRHVVIRKKTEPSAGRPAQKVTGKATDEKGHPLPGVTVLIKGTMMGVVTDADGNYNIELPDLQDVRLLFSFIGMKAQEVAYTGQKEINVTLHEEVAQMDEVVVTGMFTRKAESFTGSAATFKKEDIMRAGNQNLIKSLKNLDPSFQIMENLERRV